MIKIYDFLMIVANAFWPTVAFCAILAGTVGLVTYVIR